MLGATVGKLGTVSREDELTGQLRPLLNPAR